MSDAGGGIFSEALKNQLAKNIAFDVAGKWQDFCCERRAEKFKTDSYRKGPAPIEESEALKKSITQSTYGTLDSDVEELEFEDERRNGSNVNKEGNVFNKAKSKTNQQGNSLASCRALIVYFSKIAKTKDEDETIDLNFVDSLLQSGADINFSDRHGQTPLHEIARGWHPDIAKFALEHGADVNKADYHGRTPLHLAAAVDHEDMVEFLVQSGANLGLKTYGEMQTPMHYAAKNNAAGALKIMLRLGAQINDRDYKKRTPLFLAAETARASAARYLVEQGAPAGVYDSSGTPCLSLMIEKMPQIAMEAVEQFHVLDRAFRKHYYYLSYLEQDPSFLEEPIPESKRERAEQKERQKDEKRFLKEQGKKMKKREKTYAKTPLEVIVQYNQLDLVMHPVFQRLLYVKWNYFAKFYSLCMVGLNLSYTLIWTALGILIPRDRRYYEPLSSTWWRVVLEVLVVLLTVVFICLEMIQVRVTEKVHNRWRQWRTRHVEKDLQFCHPRWPEERKYLDSELAQIRTFQRAYFREPWNIFEWVAYFVVLTLVITRILSVASNDKIAEEIHPRIYALGLIIIWLRFMRSCRSFRSLGPFIAILGSVVGDTMKFAFLFFEFFIPYTVGFWILFGGPNHAKTMGEDSAKNWELFNDLTFSVWSMTLMGDFDMAGLFVVDRLMGQIMVGSYFALAGVVCMNLYIALLSDTFARVYAQAQANAVMQQAQMVITIEGKLGREKKLNVGHYMQDECSPLEVYSRDEGNSPDDHENDMFEKVTRQVINRIDELKDELKRQAKSNADAISFVGGRSGGGGFGGPGGSGALGPLVPIVQRQGQQIHEMRSDINEIKRLAVQIAKIVSKSGGVGGVIKDGSAQDKGVGDSIVLGGGLPKPKGSRNSILSITPPLSLYPELPRSNSEDGGPPISILQSGYGTDSEETEMGDAPRRGRPGGPVSPGMESDGGIMFSAQNPGRFGQRPPSPGSVRSAIGKRKKRHDSWDDIGAELRS